MEEMPEKIDSKFRFVLLAAKRAEQMMQGAKPKVEARRRKPSRVAMKEILDEAVDWDYGPPPEELIEEGEEVAVETE